MRDKEAFQLFLAQRRGKERLKPQTQADYLQLLARIYRETSLDVDQVSRYLNELVQTNHSASWMNKSIHILKLWGKFKNIPDFQHLQLYEIIPPVKQIMSDKQIEAFLALPWKPKWKMYWTVLAYSGMRPGEVATLTTSSVDLGRQVYDPTGKTGHRPVPIAPSVLQALTEYIKSLDGELLFPGSTGKPFTRQAWHLQFEIGIKQLGIKRKGLTAHSLRHSFITRMIDEDVSIFKIKKIVGHKRITTTEQYTHLSTKDIIKAIKKDPLARQSLTYYERYKMFREEVRKLLEDYATTPEEESTMLSGLN